MGVSLKFEVVNEQCDHQYHYVAPQEEYERVEKGFALIRSVTFEDCFSLSRYLLLFLRLHLLLDELTGEQCEKQRRCEKTSYGQNAQNE